VKNTFNTFKDVIGQGGYNLPGLLKNIDKYHSEGKLTDADREELYARARGGAKPEDSADVLAKLAEHDKEIAELKKLIATGSFGVTEETVEEYVAGKWYYNGNKCMFEGKVHTCTAPEGVVCVWSPAEHPAYWEVTA